MINRLIAGIMLVLVVSLPVVHAELLNLSYDANGNLVSGDGFFRVYDDFNQLSKVFNGSGVGDPLLMEFIYHPVEERVLLKKEYWDNGSLRETTRYVSDSFVQVENSSGTFNFTYVYLEDNLVAQVNPDGSKYFMLNDHKGNVKVVTDSNGNVVERTNYAPFGEVLSGGSEVRFGYEAKEHDSVLGDTDFDARRYKSEWGLFLQPDSLLPNVYDPQQLNRYAFERNNPFKYLDRTGRYIDTAVDVISLGVSANDIRKDPTNLWNWAALGADVASIALPVVAGGGFVVKGISKGDELANTMKLGDKVADNQRHVIDGSGQATDKVTDFIADSNGGIVPADPSRFSPGSGWEKTAYPTRNNPEFTDYNWRYDDGVDNLEIGYHNSQPGFSPNQHRGTTHWQVQNKNSKKEIFRKTVEE